MSFIVICIVIYVLIKIFGSDSSSSSSENYHSNYSASPNHIYRYGEFESGFYMEEINVFAKGPVYSFELDNGQFFWGYVEGNLTLKNSSGNIEFQLKKLTDNRIIPVHFSLNNKRFSVVDKHGNYFNLSLQNYTDISLARTMNLVLDEQSNANMDQNLLDATYEFLISLLTFNIMSKRKIILSSNPESIHVNPKYFHRFREEVESIRGIATSLFNKYFDNYLIANTDKKIESLLSILELPSNTRDLNSIKKQYKLLAKKYHPDVYLKSDTKFKEINQAYEDLCSYLKAS
ncbi:MULTISPECIES: J domain-containing protein [unclassified Bacillus (in: firmicutes)]|uniref:J domain-containing protein n=1 Tax=unclassified Bacillus (in: firmicutes) TaxID=185979 RepID=UPI0008EFE237|nr:MULTISPECIES: J domain-containing protein [unclassified Bacillus (in: firmicutes)]SFB19954.1 DnaJ domain-containing protein [Bacillus sp. UNCCL13]SFQ90792.1 DnaJ domain-containing protein [Bacillus sp. cl95]